MFHIDNAYYIPNISIRGHVCKTNISSNTAFRGFGAPQGMMITEAMIEDVALKLHKSPQKIREINLVQNNHVTYYGQLIKDCTVTQCWNQVIERAQYFEACKGIKKFNEVNRWKKRGISLIPTKYGIGYGVLFLYQATALVHIYSSDGTVLISHGGTEMGQGLHTKVVQVAANVLEIPVEMIHVSDTGTDKVPNSSVTGMYSIANFLKNIIQFPKTYIF